MARSFDFIIVGAGIVGLSIAREIKKRYPQKSIAVFEKEAGLGKHASGRNSGVLHSGIYYPTSSLKAKLCAEGARELSEYCLQHHLPIQKIGKVILPVKDDDDTQLELLLSRAKSNGARAELIDQQTLEEIEPDAHSRTGKALHSPDTAVVDPIAILDHISGSLKTENAEIFLSSKIQNLEARNSSLTANGEIFHFGHLFNTAGVYADVLAKAFGIGQKYTILPFKGSYYQLADSSGIKVNGLIYPVPDLRVPFLGVHFTKTITGKVYLGPTAIPAFGRENYKGFEGIKLSDAGEILTGIFYQYLNNKQGFRTFMFEEGRRFFKRYFAEGARVLVPTILSKHLIHCEKVGIRAQLLDKEKKELVMDFIVENDKNSTHILNAVSPAFTSAFSFSRFILDQLETKKPFH
jgi:(S)-2-hydroxyglutarate dehydrogenase